VDERRQTSHAELPLPELRRDRGGLGVGEVSLLGEPLDPPDQVVEREPLAEEILAPAVVDECGEGGMVVGGDEVNGDPKERRSNDLATFERAGEPLLAKAAKSRPEADVCLPRRLRLERAEPLDRLGCRKAAALEKELPCQSGPIQLSRGERLRRGTRRGAVPPRRARASPCEIRPRWARASPGPRRSARFRPPARRRGTC
jgi:hypothetical protein